LTRGGVPLHNAAQLQTDADMKKVSIILAICAAMYNVLGAFVQWMAGPAVPMGEAVPVEFVASRVFAAICIICSLGALADVLVSSIAMWITAVIYLLISWRFNATWVFHEELKWHIFWVPAFLSVAAFAHWRGTIYKQG
jgi:hypothetical protein